MEPLWAYDDTPAEAIVWLDLPYRTAFCRILVRHLWLSVRGQNRHKGLRRRWGFALGSRWYWKTQVPREPTGPTDWDALSRAQTIGALRSHQDKVVRLGSRRQVMAWLDQIPHDRPAAT